MGKPTGFLEFERKSNVGTSFKNKKKKHSIEIDVTNTDRSVGTIFGSEITKHFGDNTLEDDNIWLNLVSVQLMN